MSRQQILTKAAAYLPGPLRGLAKKAYLRNRHWAHPGLKQYGTVQDLYYWVSEGDLDTLLLLQNYFSVLYPDSNTATHGTVDIFTNDGDLLGTQTFDLPHLGSAKIRVSKLLTDLQVATGAGFGTLEVHIAIPDGVLGLIQKEKSLYFWDRFYISYTNRKGQMCFVHGVDKTHIYDHNKSEPQFWYPSPGGHEWAPEIPVNIDDYEKLSLIIINRTPKEADFTLVVSDTNDESLSWTAAIPFRGVHRFELTSSSTNPLVSTELRLRMKGMTTQFGRPVVFKEFRNGSFSAMHC